MKEPKTTLDPNMEPLRDYVLSKPSVQDGYPFGPEVMVFKVGGKIFAFMAWEENPVFISLKCDPQRALDLREQHPGIIPGYHLNKQHWNSITPGDSVTTELLHELIDHSYDLIVASLTQKARAELNSI